MNFGDMMAAYAPTFNAMFATKSITIEQKTLGERNGVGRQSESWTAYWTGTAAIEPISGSEPNVARQPTPQITHRVTPSEFVEGVTNQMRIVVEDGRIFEIVAAANSCEAGVFLEIDCVEGSQRE